MSGIGSIKIKTNPVVDRLRSGQPSVGCWLMLSSPVVAELMAHVGFDWLVVDVEHSPVGFEARPTPLARQLLSGGSTGRRRAHGPGALE